MKILMVHPHDVFSPLEPWTARIINLAKEFVRRGHEIKLVYFPLEWDESYTRPGEEGYEVIPLCRRVTPFYLFRNILAMVKLCKWADIVHLQKCLYYAALPALLGAWFWRKPLHYDWDDWEVKIYYYAPKQSKFTGWFLNIWEQLLPYLADTVSVSSNTLHNLCVAKGLPEDRIYFAPVGADLNKFHPKNSGAEIRQKYNITTPLALYLGQLQGGQYAELFVQAAKIANIHQPHLVFMIVGGGYRLPELKDLVCRLGLQDKVIFTGAVPGKEVPKYIASADVCVACFEDNDITRCKSPLKIAEYLASGKAIVSSNVGEVRNMVGGAGVLVKAGDASALAEGIWKVLSQPELKKQLEKRARLRAERKYNWSQTAENLGQAYQKALDLNNKPFREIIIPANQNRVSLLIDGNKLVIYEIFIPEPGKYELLIKRKNRVSALSSPWENLGIIQLQPGYKSIEFEVSSGDTGFAALKLQQIL